MRAIFNLLFFMLMASVGMLAQPYCQASFITEMNPASQTVFFSNQSFSQNENLLLNAWDFGDGMTSNEENPVHDYGRKVIIFLV